MSKVFVCGCGRKTTDPYVISGRLLCVICAEDEAPQVVNSRERKNYRRYQTEHQDVDRTRYR